MKRKILKISSVNSVKFQQLVTTEGQFECSFNKVIKFLKLTSLRKGCRKTLDFDASAEANPEILLGTLCFQPNKKITVSALSELLHQER
uniref:Uncharacterized protein n=1 Tax=Amphimedon queenslandica TaxID=400682 RepID=A0A1X7UVQ7_AMPQE